MLKIGVVIGSTRPGRKGEAVARWVHMLAAQRGDAEYALVDIARFNLPLLDEPLPPSMGAPYTHEHTKLWSAAIDALDGFVFVTPEYNHSTSGALKNAIDYLYREWNNKAVAFVSYGATGGVRAVAQLRGIAGPLQLADIRAQVSLSLFEDFNQAHEFAPRDRQAAAVTTMLDELLPWTDAMRTVRQKRAAAST